MQDLQRYNIEYQKTLLDDAYEPRAIFVPDYKMLVSDHLKDLMTANAAPDTFETGAVIASIMKFTNGQCCPRELHDVITGYVSDLHNTIELLERGFDLSAASMLRLVKRVEVCNDVIAGLQDQVNEERDKNRELRKTVFKLRKMTGLYKRPSTSKDRSKPKDQYGAQV